MQIEIIVTLLFWLGSIFTAIFAVALVLAIFTGISPLGMAAPKAPPPPKFSQATK